MKDDRKIIRDQVQPSTVMTALWRRTRSSTAPGSRRMASAEKRSPFRFKSNRYSLTLCFRPLPLLIRPNNNRLT